MAKRKRSYGRRPYRRSYKRRRTGISTAALARALVKINNPTPAYGAGTERYAKYGPSNAQMRQTPGASRSADQNFNRARDQYYGDGDYWEDMEKGALAGAGVGGMVGSGFAGIGAAPGAAVGAGIGGAIGLGTGLWDQYSGRGDYKSVNQIAGGGPTISVNRSNRTGDIFISQTEFIGNLTATNPRNSANTAWLAGKTSSKFSIEEYEINPGLDSLFPFLSQIANNYDLYEWNGLMVKYVPNSGETSVMSNQLGKVIFATNYDPDAKPFRNSVEMQNYDYSNSAKPSDEIIHGIETAMQSKSVNMMYIRDGKSTKDRVLTDIGKLYIATEGIPIDAEEVTDSPTTVVLGELHVTYTIRLSRAKLYQSLLGYGISSDRFKFYSESALAAGSLWMENPAATNSKTTTLESNKGTWKWAPTPSTNTLRFEASKQLVAGCYKWKVYVSFKQTVDDGQFFLSTIDAENCSVIEQSTVGSTTANYIQSIIIPAGNNGNAQVRYVAIGYIQVDNTNDRLPAIKLNFNAPPGVARTSIYTKISISQVSCALADELF